MGSKTDDETRAGVRYYFGVFPDGQDLRHVLYTIESETAIPLDGYPLMILDHIVAQDVRRLESLCKGQVPLLADVTLDACEMRELLYSRLGQLDNVNWLKAKKSFTMARGRPFIGCPSGRAERICGVLGNVAHIKAT